MGDVVSLLPPNATKVMRAVSLTGAARPAQQVELLATMWDPWTCPVAALDWLAYARSVDLWDTDWPELKKRSVIAASPALHRLKGTIEGVRRHLEISDAQLASATRAAPRMFASQGITKQDRDAWLARLPEIRIRYSSVTSLSGRAAFAGRAYANHDWAVEDEAEQLLGRKAVLVDGAIETPLKRLPLDDLANRKDGLDYERYALPAYASRELFSGKFAGQSFALANPLRPRIITLALDLAYDHVASGLHLGTAAAGMTPQYVGYDRIALPVYAIGQAFTRRFVGGYARSDRANANLYDRIYLHEPSKDAAWVRGHSFAGHARIGMPRFTGEIRVQVRGRARSGAGFANAGYARHTRAQRERLTPLMRALEATRVSKAFRDKVLLDTTTTQSRRFGFTLDGSARLGAAVNRSL